MTFTTMVSNLRTSLSASAATDEQPAAASASTHAAAPTTSAGSRDPLAVLMSAQGFHPDVPRSAQSTPATGTQAPAAHELPPDEVAFQAEHGKKGLHGYQELKAKMAEVAEAHKIYQQTGKVPQTKTPFSWIEIKEGRLMSRAERYDAMIKAQGKAHASGDDLAADRRNAEYLTQAEFHAEFYSRLAPPAEVKAGETNERSGWDIALGALDAVTDYTLPLKAAAKAAVSGNYEDAIALGTNALPLPPDVKLAGWDVGKDFVAGAAKQAVKSALGPIAETAERANELRKGNWRDAFPEVASTVDAPGHVYNGAKKIAEGDVRGGLHEAAPAIITLAGLIEGFAAAGRPRPTAELTEGPKQLPPGSTSSESAGGAAANAAENGANSPRKPLEETAPDITADQARETAARSAAETQARFDRTIGSTMPAEGQAIPMDTVIDGVRNQGWPSQAIFDRPTLESAWHASGGLGEPPVAFRRGNAVYVNVRQLTPAQERAFYRALAEYGILRNTRLPPVGDPSVDPRGNTPVRNTNGRGALDSTGPQAAQPGSDSSSSR